MLFRRSSSMIRFSQLLQRGLSISRLCYPASSRFHQRSWRSPSSPSIKFSSASTKPPSPNEHDPHFHLLFTCCICETRAVKIISKQAYKHGVVVVRCPGCENLHLVADNLGHFGEKRNIEKIMNESCGSFRIMDENTLEMFPEDIVGSSALKDRDIRADDDQTGSKEKPHT